MRRRSFSVWQLAQRRGALVGVVTLIAYCIGITGALPLPALSRLLASITPAEAYPCQGHACGCRNADDCFAHCCCHTPAEIAAWARARARPVALAHAEHEHDLCGAPAKAPEPSRTCCSSEDEAPAEPAQPDPAPADSDDPQAPSAPPAPPAWNFAFSPLGCQGVDGWLLVAVPCSDLRTARLDLPPPRLIARLRPPLIAAADSLRLDVPVPPPRA